MKNAAAVLCVATTWLLLQCTCRVSCLQRPSPPHCPCLVTHTSPTHTSAAADPHPSHQPKTLHKTKTLQGWNL